MASWHGNNPVNAYVSPPETLSGFPLAKRDRAKTPYGKWKGKKKPKLRKRWVDPAGNIYEWDYKRGKVEVYDSRGVHQGEFDPDTGAQTRPPEQGRCVEP